MRDEGITRDIAQEAHRHLDQNLAAIPKYDGNAPGTTGIENVGDGTMLVFNEGPQVAYLEFGTGAKGAAGAHPGASIAGYEHSNKTRWVFFDHLKGGIRTSVGIPPYASMMHAAYDTRNGASKFVVRRLKGILR